VVAAQREGLPLPYRRLSLPGASSVGAVAAVKKVEKDVSDKINLGTPPKGG
jgi:hypothetical protein